MTETLVGLFATSKAGHDKDALYVIVAEEDDFVFLCDGKLKPLQKPKKKRKKHLQLITRNVDNELLQKLKNKEPILDEEIKYAIKKYKIASQGALG